MRIIVKFLELLYNPFPFYGNFLETELRILVVIFDMIIGTPRKTHSWIPTKKPSPETRGQQRLETRPCNF